MTKNTKKNDTTLIGCGYWGTNIAKALTKLKKNKIIIYDENRLNSLILKKRFPDKTIISKNLKNILNDKNIENVILATPPEKNYQLLKQCIKNKKNIFIEKPGLKNYSEIWIIGGTSVYDLFLKSELIKINEIYITYIDSEYTCDTFFPKLNENKFYFVSKKKHEKNNILNNTYIYDIIYKSY